MLLGGAARRSLACCAGRLSFAAALCSSAASFDFQGFHRCDEVDESHPCFKPLWERIQSVRGVTSAPAVVQEWRAAGNQLSKDLMNSILLKLGSRSLFLDADKLAKWLDEEKAFELTDADKLLRLDILCHLRVRPAMRDGFNAIENKTEAAYTILLRGYCRFLMFAQAKKVMNELKASKLMTSPYPYALMLRMYARLGHSREAVRTFTEYEASGLPLDAYMCWVMLQHKDGVFSTLPVREKTLEALPKMEPTLMKIYAALGNTEALDNLWNLTKLSLTRTASDYLAALEACSLLGKLDEVEELSRELESFTGGFVARGHFVALLQTYVKLGLMDKAESVLNRMQLVERKPDYLMCRLMVDGYLKANRLDEAVECFNRMVNDKETTPQPLQALLDCKSELLKRAFTETRDVEGAEKLMTSTQRLTSLQVYNSLLEVYRSAKVSGKAKSKSLESRIVADGFKIGEVTRSLLKELEGHVKLN